jgi:hypothetical protein
MIKYNENTTIEGWTIIASSSIQLITTTVNSEEALRVAAGKIFAAGK